MPDTPEPVSPSVREAADWLCREVERHPEHGCICNTLQDEAAKALRLALNPPPDLPEFLWIMKDINGECWGYPTAPDARHDGGATDAEIVKVRVTPVEEDQ